MVHALRFRWIRHSRVCVYCFHSVRITIYTRTRCVYCLLLCVYARSLSLSPVVALALIPLFAVHIYRYRCIHICTQAAFTALVYDNHNIYVYYIGRFSVECVNICLFSSTEIFCIATARWKVNETRCVCKSTRIAYTIRDNQPNSYAVFAKSKTIKYETVFSSTCLFRLYRVVVFYFSSLFSFWFRVFVWVGWSVSQSFLAILCNSDIFFTRFIRCQFVCRNQFFGGD